MSEQLLWEQGPHQLPFISTSGKALSAQGTHLIDAGVRDVVFLEKGTKTPRVTMCSPPATPYDCSCAHPARAPSFLPHALHEHQAVTGTDAPIG